MPKKMLLAIDIGNTNIVFGIYQEEKLALKFRLNSVDKSIDDFAIDIIEAFLTAKIDIAKIENVIIASVVPNLTTKIQDAVSRFFQNKIFVIGQNLDLEIETKVENRNEVGIDRLVNSIAGFHYFGQNLIIIDFGTATTFDVVDENGCYLGGVIAPGINLSLQALHQATAKLPKIEIKKQENIIGKNTIQAMNSGVYFGYISLINGVVEKIEKELNKNTTKIITGGLAPLFNDEIKNSHHIENLTLDGILLLYKTIKK